MKNIAHQFIKIALGLLLVSMIHLPATAQHNVEVSGQITFDNGAQQYGVYGLRVYLFFEDIDDLLEGRRVLLFPDQDIEGKTYAIVEEDGSYEFDFYYPENLSRFDSLVVESSTRNAAAIVEGVAGVVGDGSCEPEDPRMECIRKAVPK